MEQFDANAHAKVIRDQVFHTFPYNQLIPNFRGPHAEDCPGCVIEAEVATLVARIEELSPVEEIIAELEKEREKREALTQDRWNAFNNAGVEKEGSVADLVENLVNQRDRLIRLVDEIENNLTSIRNKINMERTW